MLMDCLDDELTTDDIFSREKAMDKEFILLIQMACKSDNIPRAIELTKLLHHNVSFDAAMKIAEFYHLVGLKEKIAIIKADREETEDRLILARNKRRRWLKAEPPLRQLVAPTIATSHFDPLGDTRPAPAIERPGMARVTVPVIEKTRYSSVVPSTQTPEQPTWDQLTADTPPSTESKRKRVDLEVSFPSSDIPMMPPPKISKINLFYGMSSSPSNYHFNIQKTILLHVKRGLKLLKTLLQEKPNLIKRFKRAKAFLIKWTQLRLKSAPEKVGFYFLSCWNCLVKSNYLIYLLLGLPASTKNKEKKEGSRQTTLFAMLPKTDKSSRTTKKSDSTSLEHTESQSADVTMSEVDV